MTKRFHFYITKKSNFLYTKSSLLLTPENFVIRFWHIMFIYTSNHSISLNLASTKQLLAVYKNISLFSFSI
jgi:hypothetical protein